MKENMKFISLFSGVGGFDLALERLGHECVYANDIDKYCKTIYDRHFKTKLDCRSIADVCAEKLPDCDLLCGGFPCQSFSIAGKRGGFNDTRGTLFFDIARIIKEKRPRYILLENVKGLLSHDSGRTFKTILSTLTELHYDIQTMVLNSKNFGVPQNRERVFIIGHLREKPRPQVFPLGESKPVPTEGQPKTGKTIANTLRAKQGGPDINQTYVSRFPFKFAQRNQRTIQGDYAYTVDGANTGGVMVNWEIRKFTPTECERLQGFPDGWTEGVSDTQRYKQMGNAVTVNVIYEIMKHL